MQSISLFMYVCVSALTVLKINFEWAWSQITLMKTFHLKILSGLCYSEY